MDKNFTFYRTSPGPKKKLYRKGEPWLSSGLREPSVQTDRYPDTLHKDWEREIKFSLKGEVIVDFGANFRKNIRPIFEENLIFTAGIHTIK